MNGSLSKSVTFSNMKDDGLGKVLSHMDIDSKSSRSSSTPMGRMSGRQVQNRTKALETSSKEGKGELYSADKSKNITRQLKNYLESERISVDWRSILNLINLNQAQLVSEMYKKKSSDKLLTNVSKKLRSDVQTSLKSMIFVKKQELKVEGTKKNINRSVKCIRDLVAERRTEYKEVLTRYREALNESANCLKSFDYKQPPELVERAIEFKALRVKSLLEANAYSSFFRYDSEDARWMDVREIDALRANLARLRFRLSTAHPQSKQVETIENLFQEKLLDSLSTAIEKLPRSLKEEVRKVFSNHAGDIKKCIAQIRDLTITNPKVGYDLLAAWIDSHKIPWKKFAHGNITPQEEREIASRITYVDLRDLCDQWNDAQLEDCLQGFPNVKHLTIAGAKKITRPVLVKSLISLDCSMCDELISLPKMPALKKLLCVECPNLLFLPSGLKNLEELDCSATNIKQLPDDMRALKRLDCQECHELVSLPKQMPELQSLNCRQSPVAALISYMPKIESLDCSECPLETLFSYMPKLKSLNCSGCPLSHLPSNMTLLECLKCIGCKNLEALPDDLKMLKHLDCSFCPKLVEIPKKLSLRYLRELFCANSQFTNLSHSMEDLEILDCSDSNNLEYLTPNLPELRYLDCRKSSKLKLPRNGLPAITILECDKKLHTELPEYKHAISDQPRALDPGLYDRVVDPQFQ